MLHIWRNCRFLSILRTNGIVESGMNLEMDQWNELRTNGIVESGMNFSVETISVSTNMSYDIARQKTKKENN